jgi:UrcA family protein
MTTTPLFAIVGALLLAPLPALAGDLPTRLVRYGDLDLTKAEGVARLEHRVAAAARLVCRIDDPRDLTQSAIARKCRSAALAAAQRQTQAAIAEAHSNRQLASSSGAPPALR